MDARQRADLDRHITGDWGERAFADDGRTDWDRIREKQADTAEVVQGDVPDPRRDEYSDGRSEARIRADLALPPIDGCDAAKRAAALAHALLTELVGADILDEETISDLSPDTWAEIQAAIAASAPYALYKPPTGAPLGATADDAMRTWREEDR